MTRAPTLCAFALLLTFPKFGSALRCYQCNSQSDPACADPFTATKYLVDCATQDSVNYNRNYLREILPQDIVDGVLGAPRYCHKIVLETGTTVRTCLDANPSDLNQTCQILANTAKYPLTDPKKQIKHCSVCDTEGCNSAVSLHFSLQTLFLLFSALVYSRL